MRDVPGPSEAQKTARLAVAVTVAVVAVKGSGAALSGSVAVLAEAVQSLVDIVLALGTAWAIAVAARPADETHPYGHGKAELLASAFQTLASLGSTAFIVYKAWQRFAQPADIQAPWAVGSLALAAGMTAALWLRIRAVQARTGSLALAGEARHQMGDLLATLGILAGVLLMQATGIQALDPAAALVFAGLSAALAARQMLMVAARIMDPALPESDLAKVRAVLDQHPEVRGYHDLRSRDAGGVRVVELHVMLDDAMTFVQAHRTAEQVESAIAQALGWARVTVHYEPYEDEMAHRQAEHG